MTYAELVQALKDYLENEETTFVSQIPTFIRQAEQRIYRSVMIPELRKNATSVTTLGNPYLARPGDMISVFSFAVVDGSGNYQFLLEKDVSFIREAYPSAATQGVPRFYAQFDGDSAGAAGTFFLGPTPAAAYTVELHYYFDPPSIVTSGTSWLGTHAAPALLYGSLVEAYTFEKGDADLLKIYTDRYTEAMSQLFSVDVRTKRDDYRDGRS